MNGRIFSIEEFSTFDGPGIRATVFFKGCPLSCSWCHNPESQRFEVEYLKQSNGCLGCNACFLASKTDWVDENSVKACPKSLIKKCGEDYESERLVAKLKKLSPILSQYGGGVTFSGGEPLARWEFLFECLDGLRPQMHCAVQTCGYCDSEIFKKMLTRVDYVLYDLKIIDSKKHEFYCGRSNDLILQNWRILVDSGVDFITRVPLIPTVTDTTENLTQIACLLQEKGIDRVELLPYNRLAGAKYSSLNRVFEPKFDSERDCVIDFAPFVERGIQAKVL